MFAISEEGLEVIAGPRGRYRSDRMFSGGGSGSSDGRLVFAPLKPRKDHGVGKPVSVWHAES